MGGRGGNSGISAIPQSNVSGFKGIKEHDSFFGTVAKVSNKYMMVDQVTDKDKAIIMTKNVAVVKGNAVLVTGENSAVYLKDWQFRRMVNRDGEEAYAVKINRNYFKEYTFKGSFDYIGAKSSFDDYWNVAAQQQRAKNTWKSGGVVIISHNKLIPNR